MLAHNRRRPRGIHAAGLRYASRLRTVAQQAGRIVRGLTQEDPASAARIESRLNRYAESLHEWARDTAQMMLHDIERLDAKQWKARAQNLSRALRRELLHAPTGEVMRALLDEQAVLIQSIPEAAARRVHEWALEGIQSGARHTEIVSAIQELGNVAVSRANLIARTETSRAAMTLTQARAQYVGSDGYLWRTAGDGDVRPSHRKMNGEFVKWDKPPTLDKLTGHAGCLPNCRCYAEPVIPE